MPMNVKVCVYYVKYKVTSELDCPPARDVDSFVLELLLHGPGRGAGQADRLDPALECHRGVESEDGDVVVECSDNNEIHNMF